MQKNLKIALKRRSSEQGFAIPIAMELGLVMILIGATMLVRSQSAQSAHISASAQRGTAQSLSLSEVGVTCPLSFFRQILSLATRRYNSTISHVTKEWNTPEATFRDSRVSSTLADVVTNGWIPLSGFSQVKITYIQNSITVLHIMKRIASNPKNLYLFNM